MFLRKMLVDDLRMVFSWRNTPEVRRNMYTHQEITWDEHVSWFERIDDDPACRYFIYVAENEAHGVVYFTELNQIHHNAFWGFYAGPLAPAGSGTVMEFLTLEMAFGEQGLHKLNCEVISYNQKVINLHKKNGFLVEGVFRDYHFDGEFYHDVIRFGMLQNEWFDVHRERLETRIQKLNKKC